MILNIKEKILNVVFIVSNRFANGYGSNELAAYTIGYNIWIFTSFFIDGFSSDLMMQLLLVEIISALLALIALFSRSSS